MNDTQLLDRLGRANAYADDAPLPETIRTHELALREIDRRIPQVGSSSNPAACPRNSK